MVAAAAGLAVAFSGTAQASVTTVSAAPTSSPGFDGLVLASAYAGNILYVGGDFTHAVVGGRKLPRNRLAAIDMSTGSLLPWAPSADATVRALAVDPTGGAVYAGGSFMNVNAQPRTALAQLDPVSGALQGTDHGITGVVRALTVANGRVYVGGKLATVDGTVVGNLAVFTAATGQLDPGFLAYTDDAVEALAVADTRLYIGGPFRTVSGLTGTPKLAALDAITGARDSTFRPKISIRVFGLAVGPDGLYVAMGGQGGRVAGLGYDGSLQWTRTTDGDVRSLALLDGVLYIGGHFDNVCATNVNGLQGTCTDGSIWRVKFAAVDAASGELLPWDPHANGINGVLTMTANPNTRMVAGGGEFTTVGGVWWPRFAEFGYTG